MSGTPATCSWTASSPTPPKIWRRRYGDSSDRLKVSPMEFTGFITAAGFLAAILLVWAQLWIRTYDKRFRESLNVKLGLFWTIYAILLALLAFSYALFYH